MSHRNSHMEDILDAQVYPNDIIFNEPERLLVFGTSNSGKSYLVEKLVQKHAHRFHKIVISGNRNRLLDFPETKKKTQLYQGNHYDEGIYDPLSNMDHYQLNKLKQQDKQLLVIYDDLMEAVFKSSVISKLYSRGRHLGISIIVIMQSYFPTGAGKNLFPQIKNNSTIQIFTKMRSECDKNNIAQRLESGKVAREVFNAIFKKTVQEVKFGYLVCMLDASDSKLRYCNNILDEDGTPFWTVYV